MSFLSLDFFGKIGGKIGLKFLQKKPAKLSFKKWAQTRALIKVFLLLDTIVCISGDFSRLFFFADLFFCFLKVADVIDKKSPLWYSFFAQKNTNHQGGFAPRKEQLMSYTKDFITGREILQDKKFGKVTPWRPKKIKNTLLSDSFERLGKHNKALRAKSCGCRLEFEIKPETDIKRLLFANFCNVRSCPMCQWRRSLKAFCQLSKIMDEAQKRDKNLVPLFLTLTVKNCAGDRLESEIDGMLKGWGNFYDHYAIRKIIKGWFRAVEVTYDKNKLITRSMYAEKKDYYTSLGLKIRDKNPGYDTFHPHMHVIILVDKSYFKGKDYKQTAEWVRLWRTSAGLDYNPVCDIREVKTTKAKHKAVAEVAKYTLKDSEYLTNDKNLTDKLVKIFDAALRKKRLFAYGGVLKLIAKELKLERASDRDLIHIGADEIRENEIREDVAALFEVYSWDFKAKNYFKSQR